MIKKIALSVTLMLSVVGGKAQFPAKVFEDSSIKKLPPTAEEVFAINCIVAGFEKKNVFVIFHASWCGWCKRMDKSMEDPACKEFFDKNYRVVHFVVNESADKKHLETVGGEDFMAKYNGKGRGIPFWLIFDKDGKLLADAIMRKEDEGPDKGDNTGCPASEKEVAHFIDVLKKTSSLKDGELEIIRKRFRENDR
jgi:thiol-disulfide isomerase/thioredoxin